MEKVPFSTSSRRRTTITASKTSARYVRVTKFYGKIDCYDLELQYHSEGAEFKS
jgi:hypothetical protein